MLVEEDNAPYTHIKESPIGGLGLFASKPFNLNDIIVDYNPFRKSFYKIKWIHLLPEQYNKNWLIPIDDEYCLTNDKLNKIHYINHSSTPNCNWFIKDLLVTANRNIKEGEELFINYRLEVRPNRSCFPEWI